MRCYNGAWDTQARALLAEEARLLQIIRVHEPGASVTYHAPHGDSGGGFGIHVWGRLLSPLLPTRLQALRRAASPRGPCP